MEVASKQVNAAVYSHDRSMEVTNVAFKLQTPTDRWSIHIDDILVRQYEGGATVYPFTTDCIPDELLGEFCIEGDLIGNT
jgi:hypothetical protein